MKTIFIVCKKRLNYFNFQNISEIKNFNLILITEKNALKGLSSDFLDYFQSYTFIESFDEKSIDTLIGQYIVELNLANNFKIICLDETLLLLVAALREKYDIPGAKYHELLAFRNKVMMKKKLQISGINVPRFVSLEEYSAEKDPIKLYEAIKQTTSVPFIVKPVAGASSLGTCKIENKEQFIEWHSTNDNLNSYEAEEYIDGIMYHVDGLYFDKEIIFSAVSEYINPCLAFTYGKTIGSIPLQNTSPIYQKLTLENNKIVQQLALPDGAFHTEFFLTKNNISVFIEIAARPAGGPIVKTLEKSFDINLYESILKYELGLPFSTIKTNKLLCGWAYLPIGLGVVNEIRYPQIISPHNIIWEVESGEYITTHPTSVIGKKAGILQFWNQDYIALQSDFNYLRHDY